MSSTVVGPYAPVERALRAQVGDIDGSEAHGAYTVRVPAGSRVEALAALKAMGFTHYLFCAGVDYPDENRLEVLDHVYDFEQQRRVTVRCDIPRDEPRIASAIGVYRGADWHERETWELFGIVFAGHPRLSRLLLPDWFEGFPMRKDFVLAPRVEKPWPGESFKPE